METGSRDYVTIPKGRGYVYAYKNQLYNRVKTEGNTKYLKCDVSGCDGSAKVVDGLQYIVVRINRHISCHCLSWVTLCGTVELL